MSTPRIFFKSLLANWVGYVANAIVALLLSRYVVAKLGVPRYGVWQLIITTTGYLSLAELGTRGGIGRFINYYIGKKREGMLSSIVTTALGIFFASTIVLIPAALILGLSFNSLYEVPDGITQQTLIISFILVTLNLWMGFLCSPFTQLLTSRHRFDIYNAINLLAIAIRAFGTMFALARGGGLVSLAAVQVISTGVALLLSFIIATQLYPSLEIHPRHLSRIRLREMFGFGIWTFLSSSGSKLLHSTDLIVVGALVVTSGHSGPWWVVFYSLPGLLVTYSRELLSHVANVLAPHAVQLCGAENKLALREVLRWGGKFTMLIALPYYAGLALFGPRFLQLFYNNVFEGENEHMIRISQRVLWILIIPQVTLMAIRPGAAIINGLGHVRFGALMTLGQGVINLALSIMLVGSFNMGIEGVAWGTLVPMIFCNAILCLFLLEKIHYRKRRYFRENALPFLSAAGAMLILMALSTWANLGQFAYLFTNGKSLDWISLFIEGTVFMLVALPVTWLFVFLPSERAVAKDYLFLHHRQKEIDYAVSGSRNV
jgi:O-antigen/teichoic acid export membrane protein